MTPQISCFLSFRFKGYKSVSNYLIPTCSPHVLIGHIPNLHYSNLLFLQTIDAFELWCWRKLVRAPWTARRSNQSILKEINPEYSLEGLMLKLKLQSFGHLMWRTDSLEKTLMLGKIEDRRRRGRQRWDGWMASPIQWTWTWANWGRWWGTGKPGVLQSMGLQRVGHNLVNEQQQQWNSNPQPHFFF